MTITPEQAQEWLDGATPGPWAHDEVPGPGEDPTRATEVYPKDECGVIAYVQPSAADVELIAAAPDLAETIAGMRWEWALSVSDGEAASSWMDSREEAEPMRKIIEREFGPSRLVRRLVSAPEVVEGE